VAWARGEVELPAREYSPPEIVHEVLERR
jgi:hypothetical protein